MFARYFIELPLDAERVEEALVRDPQEWLPGLARTANARGDALLAQIGFGDKTRVERPVAIEFGAMVRTPTKTVIPLWWVPAGSAGLFPTLDADLEIASLSLHRTQLAMSARYVPPFGALGRTIDRVVLFRVAEATLKDFLDRVGEAVIRAEERARTATG